MINLSKHIEYLLLRHDCVVLPGIGAFINVYRSARFDEDMQIWFPMTREVRFNRALIHDDGLLASSYSRKLKISFEEGRQTLHKALEILCDSLNLDGEVTIGNLGILTRKGESLEFKPFQDAERLSKNLGFHPVDISQISENPDSSVSCAQMTMVKDHSQSGKENEKIRPVFDTSRNYYIPVNKIFAKVAASLVFVLIVALTVIMPISTRTQVDKASVLPVENLISDVDKLINKETNEDAQIAENDTDDISSDCEKFHAVIAVFTSHKEAEKYIEINKDCGYRLQIKDFGKQSRVIGMSASDKDELTAKIHEGDFKDKFRRAWIWEE